MSHGDNATWLRGRADVSRQLPGGLSPDFPPPPLCWARSGLVHPFGKFSFPSALERVGVEALRHGFKFQLSVSGCRPCTSDLISLRLSFSL